MSGKPSQSPNFEESFHAWNSSGGTNQACIEHYTPLGTPEKCICAPQYSRTHDVCMFDGIVVWLCAL